MYIVKVKYNTGLFTLSGLDYLQSKTGVEGVLHPKSVCGMIELMSGIKDSDVL